MACVCASTHTRSRVHTHTPFPNTHTCTLVHKQETTKNNNKVKTCFSFVRCKKMNNAYGNILKGDRMKSCQVKRRKYRIVRSVIGKRTREWLRHETERGKSQPLQKTCPNQIQVPNLILVVHFREGFLFTKEKYYIVNVNNLPITFKLQPVF